jgi:hypothetical protein
LGGDTYPEPEYRPIFFAGEVSWDDVTASFSTQKFRSWCRASQKKRAEREIGGVNKVGVTLRQLSAVVSNFSSVVDPGPVFVAASDTTSSCVI